MDALPSSHHQSKLQAAVQSVQWTYSLFWQICPQQGALVWADGYYNGAIKTRKTVQPVEVTSEEASLQRSQQLRELYESLSAGDANQPARRPSAALSPEDLTESEWFYLMCVSFSFPPGVGLPGKAYARGQHVWLTGANEVDSKTFSRAILAKSAHIQTVVCVPIQDGVVEFGTTEKVEEDTGLVKHVKSFFEDEGEVEAPPPKPALSEHSTSNPTVTSSDRLFQSPPLLYSDAHPPQQNQEEEDDDEEEEEEGSDSEAENGLNDINGEAAGAAAVSEVMQLEMSEDIRMGSPDDASNNLDSDFNLLAVNHSADPPDAPPFQRRWPLQVMDTILETGFQPPPPSGDELTETQEEDTHYSQTVSTILHVQPSRWGESASKNYSTCSNQTAFARWTGEEDHIEVEEGTSQWVLKYMVMSVPFLHSKYRDENSPKSRGDPDSSASRFRKTATPQDELSANHVLAERRRREKLNERFITLRNLVPFVTKMDKASILADTIEYLKQLRTKIHDLESRNRQMEIDHQQRTAPSSPSDKRKLRIVEGIGGSTKPKAVEPPTSVQVSIIETDALLELQCHYREGLLLDVMNILRNLRIETTTVQSSLNNGFFVAELRAKVKENLNGKKTSIVEVKRAINTIVPHTDS